MNKPEQQLIDDCESHVIDYIAHLEDSLRGLFPAPRVDLRIIPTPPQPVFATSEWIRQTALALRN